MKNNRLSSVTHDLSAHTRAALARLSVKIARRDRKNVGKMKRMRIIGEEECAKA